MHAYEAALSTLYHLELTAMIAEGPSTRACVTPELSPKSTKRLDNHLTKLTLASKPAVDRGQVYVGADNTFPGWKLAGTVKWCERPMSPVSAVLCCRFCLPTLCEGFTEGCCYCWEVIRISTCSAILDLCPSRRVGTIPNLHPQPTKRCCQNGKVHHQHA